MFSFWLKGGTYVLILVLRAEHMFPLPGCFYPHSSFLVKSCVYYIYFYFCYVDNYVECRKNPKNKKVPEKK